MEPNTRGLQSFSVGYVGLQLELLADAVPSRGRGQGGNAAAHHSGDSPLAVSVSGGQDLAPCGKSWCQLQRPLRRARYLRPPDGPTAGDRQRWKTVRPSIANSSE